AGVVGGLERVAAAARGDRVRVVDGESRVYQAVDVVDLGAFEIVGAVFVDVDLDVVLIVDLVPVLNAVIQGHAVLETGAAARGHEDTQSRIGFALLFDELLELIYRGRGQRNHPGAPCRAFI